MTSKIGLGGPLRYEEIDGELEHPVRETRRLKLAMEKVKGVHGFKSPFDHRLTGIALKYPLQFKIEFWHVMQLGILMSSTLTTRSPVPLG